MPDAIADLGHCAAVCELEAHLCPWERAELERRAAAYRAEQLKQLELLAPPFHEKSASLLQFDRRNTRPPQATSYGSRNRPHIPAFPERNLWGSHGVSRKM